MVDSVQSKSTNRIGQLRFQLLCLHLRDLPSAQVYIHLIILPFVPSFLTLLLRITSLPKLFFQPSQLPSLFSQPTTPVYNHLSLLLNGPTLSTLHSKMSAASSSSGAAAAKAPVYDSHGEQLRSHLQARPLKFHLKAGNAKWACTLIHKNEL